MIIAEKPDLPEDEYEPTIENGFPKAVKVDLPSEPEKVDQ